MMPRLQRSQDARTNSPSEVPFGGQPLGSTLGDFHFSFTLDRRAWGHRCANSVTGTTGVVLPHPQRKVEHLVGQERFIIERVSNRFDGREVGGWFRGADHDAGHKSWAQRNHNTGPAHRLFHFVRNAIGELIEERNRDSD